MENKSRVINVYKQPQAIPEAVLRDVVFHFIKAICEDSRTIAARWTTKQINGSSNIEDNIYELCYMIFSQEMKLTLISENVLLYDRESILCIPKDHLNRETVSYLNAMRDKSSLFFRTKLNVSFGTSNYYNFIFNDDLNKSKLRYAIFSNILLILVETNIANNNIDGATSIVKGIIKHIILRTKEDFVKSSTTNEIHPAFKTTALTSSNSISALKYILNLSDNVSDLKKTLTSQSYLLEYENRNYTTSIEYAEEKN